MNADDLKRIERLVEEAIYSPTKTAAKLPLRKLNTSVLRLRSRFDGYTYRKLREVISFATEASGQVSNKDHWISCVRNSWSVFMSNVSELNRDDREGEEK